MALKIQEIFSLIFARFESTPFVFPHSDFSIPSLLSRDEHYPPALKTMIIHLYRVPGAITRYHKLGSLKGQKFILSQSWRPNLQDQGGSRALLPLPLGLWTEFFLGFS